jgi:hypothetical protein
MTHVNFFISFIIVMISICTKLRMSTPDKRIANLLGLTLKGYLNCNDLYIYVFVALESRLSR